MAAQDAMVTLLCTVRSCRSTLHRQERALVCERGHSFDVARSGYLNLLQPQDRRSRNPGDSKPSVKARRRWLESGHEKYLAEAIENLAASELPDGAAVLDVGCGEGTHLAGLMNDRPLDAHGTDISVDAIDLAARRHPLATWTVANADRFLPYAGASFDLLLSITARRNAPEFRRVLKSDGRLLLVIPADDDLVELREAVMGEGLIRARSDRVISDFTSDFELATRQTVRHLAKLEPAQIRDLLSATYRGARESQRSRVEALKSLQVTLSREMLLFRPKG